MNSEVETKILDLFSALNRQGITLEAIKIDKPLLYDGKEVSNLHGIDVKTVYYEDEATHWRTRPST